MGINATLIGQMGTFFVFVFVMMKFIWPPIMKALEERQKKIADGLAAADRSQSALEEAQIQANDVLREARGKATEIIDAANQRRNQVVEEAKVEASAERARQLTAAQAEIANESHRAREALRNQVATLAVAGAERLLSREVDAQTHKALLDELIAEI